MYETGYWFRIASGVHFHVGDDGLIDFAINPDDWEPHVVTRGPRKGMNVWKNTKTGRLRDEAPPGKADQTDKADKTDKAGKQPAEKAPKGKGQGKGKTKEPEKAASPVATPHPYGPGDTRPFRPEQLDEKAQLAINQWTGAITPEQKKAVSFYTGCGYHDLNRGLRKCPATLSCLDDYTRDHAKHLMEFLNSAPVLEQPIVSWRGLKCSTSKKREAIEAGLQKAFASGGEVQMPGFGSSTLKAGLAANWGNQKTVLEFRHRRGALISNVSDMPDEDEVLLQHNSRWRVTAIHEHAPYQPSQGASWTTGRRTYVLEAVDDGPVPVPEPGVSKSKAKKA